MYLLLDTLGADVTLVAPPTLLPVGVETWPCRVSYDPGRTPGEDRRRDDASGSARANERLLLPLRTRILPPRRTRRRPDGPAPRVVDSAAPGPMNRGMERSPPTWPTLPRSVIVEQVTNGVSVRMAVLYLLLGAPPRDRRCSRDNTCRARQRRIADAPALVLISGASIPGRSAGRPSSSPDGPSSRWAGRSLAVPEESVVVEADGLLALPGPVDLHTHPARTGPGGRRNRRVWNPGSRPGGFTAVHAMANTRSGG